MSRPAEIPHDLDAQGFSVEEAMHRGVPRSRLRADDLTAPFHGVRRQGPATTTLELARALVARLPDGARFSHTTAAVMLGLRMPHQFHERALHVSVPRPRRALRVAGVLGHQVPQDARLVIIHGLPMSTPIDAWIQCASLISLDDLIVMGDGLVRRKRPLATLEELNAAAASVSTQRGSKRLREALEFIRARTDSARETMLRLLLVRAGFPEPEINGAIVNRYGAVIAHGDLVYRREKVIVEYDGEYHLTAAQRSIDLRRLDDLREEGWYIIQVDKALMATRAALLAKISRALSR